MAQPGMVFHSIVTTERRQGELAIRQTHEIWIDVPRNLARVEVATAFAASGENTRLATWIIDDGAWYQSPVDGPAIKREALACRDAPSAAMSLITGCQSFAEDMRVSAGTSTQLNGRTALPLVFRGVIQGSGERTEFTETLWIDDGSGLPIERETSGVIAGERVESLEAHTRFESDFIRAEALPSDFFAPASIGYAGRDAAAPMAGFGLAWPGRTIGADSELPALELATAYVPVESAATPGYAAELTYTAAGTEFAVPELVLEIWDTAARGGRPRGPVNAVRVVTAGNTVVVIRAAPGSAWDSEAGVRVIATSLMAGADAATEAGAP
jgi:hypothetical protein